jgi:hypothetical protein
LDKVATYIQRLSEISRGDRVAAFQRTAGSLTEQEADAWEKVINADCEKVDERNW